MQAANKQESALRKELGLRDLVLAQVLCVVGSTWVGVAAKLGRSEAVFWLSAMALFYLPLAVVVIYLNRLMPLEGGLYQWAKQGFGEMAGFLTAWNLWVYAIVSTGAIVFVIPTDIFYAVGPSARMDSRKQARHVRPHRRRDGGHRVGGHSRPRYRQMAAQHRQHHDPACLRDSAGATHLGARQRANLALRPHTMAGPKLNWFGVAIFGQMTVGALSGFEYVAILAGETRSAARSIGQSVVISAPIICMMFILGTSSVLTFLGGQPVNVIGPIPQTLRAAAGHSPFGNQAVPFAIALLIARAIAAASLLLTGLTRLPMTAGWDHLRPPGSRVSIPSAAPP